MRKVLSFVLVLALVLGSFSMAFGLTDVAGNDKEQAISVANDLGIIEGFEDGTFKPDQAVNRAQFAAMITRALGIPDSALAGYTATGFKDVAGYGWAVSYLAFCESKGIMEGDGMGNVMPGRTISVNEAITMVARALGYTNNSAVLVGSWPSNYVSLAQDLGLYTDLATATTVDRANAAQVIYNALTVDKVQVNADGETKPITVNGVNTNMLTAGLDCTVTTAAVYYDAAALIDTTKYVGANGDIYKNSDNEVVAIKQKTTFLTGKFNTSFSKFTADGVEYTVKNYVTDTPHYATNAALIANTTLTLAGIALADTTYTVAADVSGKTIDLFSVGSWSIDANKKVTASDLKALDSQKLLGVEFEKDNNGEIKDTTFQLVGVASVDDIVKDNIVYVYKLGKTGKIVKVAVGTEVVEGKVTAYNADDEFTVNGATYENSGTVAANNIAVGDVGKTLKMWLDGYGDVYSYEVIAGQASNYAVVAGANIAMGYESQIKLFTAADGSSKIYTFDTSTDGVTGSTTGAVGQLVAYGLNNDGEVDAYDNDAVAKAAWAGTTETAVTFAVADAVYLANTRTLTFTSTTAMSWLVSADVAVFTYDSGSFGGDYAVSSVDKVKTGSSNTFSSPSAVFLDDEGVVVAMLIPAADASKTDDSVFAVINSRETTLNADDDTVYRLAGLADGAAWGPVLTDGKNISNNYNVNIILYKFGLDADGVINKVTLAPVAYAAGTGIDTMTSGGGVVVSGSGVGYVKVGTAGGTIDTVTFVASQIVPIASDAVFYEVEYNTTTGKIKSYSEFYGSVDAGDMVWVFDTDDETDGYDVVIVKVAE